VGTPRLQQQWPVLQQVPTEQSKLLEQVPPICAVPLQTPVWQLLEAQSDGALQAEPFGEPPAGAHVPVLAQFPERQSALDPQELPSSACGSHTMTLEPDTSGREAHVPARQLEDALHVGRHPGLSSVLVVVDITVLDTHAKLLGQSASLVQALLQSPVASTGAAHAPLAHWELHQHGAPGGLATLSLQLTPSHAHTSVLELVSVPQ
jgi:hypothetical protein